MDTPDRDEPRLVWGEREGRMVHVGKVDNGLACACVCKDCRARLIARNRGSHRQPHFAHYNVPACRWAPESALHRVAKELIGDADSIRLPPLPLSLGDAQAGRELNGDIPDAAWWSESFIIAHADLESRIGEYVADVVLSSAAGHILIVEIVVTNPPGNQKRLAYSAFGIPCLVLDLHAVDRALDPEALRYLLIDSVDFKSWAYPDHVPDAESPAVLPAKGELPGKVAESLHPEARNTDQIPDEPLRLTSSIPEVQEPVWPQSLAGSVRSGDDQDLMIPDPVSLGRRLLELNRIATEAHGDWWPDEPMHPDILMRLKSEADAGDPDARECLRRERLRHPR